LAAPLLLFYSNAVIGDAFDVRQCWQFSVFVPVLFVGLVFPQSALWIALFKVAYVFTYLVLAARTYFGRSATGPSVRTYWFYLLFGGVALLSVSGAVSVLQAFLSPSSAWLISENVTIPITMLLLLTLIFAGVRFHGPFHYYAEGGQYRLRTPPVSGQERAILKSVFESFESSMNSQKLYIESTYGLSDAAELMGLNSQVLSQAINEHAKGGFSDWMACARTREFVALLSDTGNVEVSLLDLGLMAGFGSKSTFNRVVKEQTGLSPRQLRLNVSKNSMP